MVISSWSQVLAICALSRRFLGIISQNPSVSKSNRIHVVIFRCLFDNLICIPQILKQLVIFLKS